MFPLYVALVSETNAIPASEVNRVAAALQKQAVRDFEPIWNVRALVSAFSTLEDVPLGYWPIIVRDDIGFPGAAGIHLDKDGQPFALVMSGSHWSLTASHELLEMLADPFGNRLIAGTSPKPDQGRVEFLVEVCDPSEAVAFAYQVNGIVVSDFYTPHYFDPVGTAGIRYSYTGAITKPREVLKGGYLSWHEPVTNHWWQFQFFSGKGRFVDLGVFTAIKESLRAMIDGMTVVPARVESQNPKTAFTMATFAAEASLQEPAQSKASSWHEQIEVLKATYSPE